MEKRELKTCCHNTFILIMQKVTGEAYLMQRLRAKTPEVPHHVWILQMSLRVPLLAMDEGRKLICPEVEEEKEKKINKDKAVRSLRKKKIYCHTLPAK